MAVLAVWFERDRVKPRPHALKDGTEFKASASTSVVEAPILKAPVQQQRLFMQ